MTIYQRAVLAVSVVLAWVSAVPALPWTELGDAGALPGTAQSTQGAGPGSLTSINGSLSDLDQEDMFVIQVTDPLAFSATTVGTGGGGLIEDS
ncbi:MAG TPA: hypothetical protein VH878_09620, partial [Thermodesulfobacteriota bacterium]